MKIVSLNGSLQDSFSTFQSMVYELVDSIVDELCCTLCTVVHSVYHWFIRSCSSKNEKQMQHDDMFDILVVLNIFPLLAYQILKFLNISHILRNIYLHKSRFNYSDDDFAFSDSYQQ